MKTDSQLIDWKAAGSNVLCAWSEKVSSGDFNPSLDPRWISLAAESRNITRNLKLAVVGTDTNLSGFVPLQMSVLGPRHLRSRHVEVAYPVSYHAEIVADVPPEDVLRSVLVDLLAGEWDIFSMSNVVRSSPTAAVLRSLRTISGVRVVEVPTESSPYLNIDSDWDGFLLRKKKKFRAMAKRNIEHPLKGLGEANLEWFEPGADTDRLLQQILDVERRSWKAKAGRAVSDSSEETEYHRLLLPYLSQTGMLMASVLSLEGIPVAFALCCRSNGWVGLLKTSYDERVRNAGSCVLTSSVQRAFQLRCDEYDFLGGPDDYKLRWSSQLRDHSTFHVFAGTPRGRILGRLRRSATGDGK